MLEGAEDYELFMSLRAAGKPGAEALIKEATDAVLRDYRLNNWGWSGDRRRATADTYRLKAIRLLEWK